MESAQHQLDALREQLVVLDAQRGTAEAFRRLVDTYERRLLYYVRRILGDSDGALDVLQEIWLTVHRKLDTLESPAAFRTWLFRIARDKSVDALRRRQRAQAFLTDLAEEQGPDESPDTTEPPPGLDDVERLHRELVRLSGPHREVLTLRFLEDLSLAEIAVVVGCPVGTVKSRLHHACRLLRERLENTTHD